MLKRLSLKWKLILITTVTSTGALIISAAVFAFYDRESFKEQMVHELQMQVRVLGENVAESVKSDNRLDATAALSALRVNEHIEESGIYKTNGRVFSAYARSGEFSPEFPSTALAPGFYFDKDHLNVSSQISYKGLPVGYVIACVGVVSVLTGFVGYCPACAVAGRKTLP